MTENDGLDVIVAASGGAVAAPGVAGGAPAVLFHQTAVGTWEVETGAGCSGPWSSSPVATNQSDPVGIARRRRPV